MPPSPTKPIESRKMKRVKAPAETKPTKRARLIPDAEPAQVEASLLEWFDKWRLPETPEPKWADHKDVWETVRQGEASMRSEISAKWFVRLEGHDLDYFLNFARGRLAREMNRRRKAAAGAITPKIKFKFTKAKRTKLGTSTEDEFEATFARFTAQQAAAEMAAVKVEQEAVDRAEAEAAVAGAAAAATAARVAEEAARVKNEEVDELVDDSDAEVHNALLAATGPPKVVADTVPAPVTKTPSPVKAVSPVVVVDRPAEATQAPRVVTLIPVPTRPPAAYPLPAPSSPLQLPKTVPTSPSPSLPALAVVQASCPSSALATSLSTSRSPSPNQIRSRSPLPTASPPPAPPATPPIVSLPAVASLITAKDTLEEAGAVAGGEGQEDAREDVAVAMEVDNVAECPTQPASDSAEQGSFAEAPGAESQGPGSPAIKAEEEVGGQVSDGAVPDEHAQLPADRPIAADQPHQTPVVARASTSNNDTKSAADCAAVEGNAHPTGSPSSQATIVDPTTNAAAAPTATVSFPPPQPSLSPTTTPNLSSAFPLRRKFVIPKPRTTSAATPTAPAAPVVFGSGWRPRPSGQQILEAPRAGPLPAMRGFVHEAPSAESAQAGRSRSHASQPSGTQPAQAATVLPSRPTMGPRPGSAPAQRAGLPETLAQYSSSAGGQTQAARPQMLRPVNTAPFRLEGPASAPAVQVASSAPTRQPGQAPALVSTPSHAPAVRSVSNPYPARSKLVNHPWPEPKPSSYPRRWTYLGRELKLGLVEALWQCVDRHGGGTGGAWADMELYARGQNIHLYQDAQRKQVHPDVAGMFEEVVAHYEACKREAAVGARGVQRSGQGGLARSQGALGGATVQPWGRPDQSGQVYQPSQQQQQQQRQSSGSAQPSPTLSSSARGAQALSQSLNGRPSAAPRHAGSTHQRAGSLPGELPRMGTAPSPLLQQAPTASLSTAPPATAAVQEASAGGAREQRNEQVRQLLRPAVAAMQRLAQFAAQFPVWEGQVVAAGGGSGPGVANGVAPVPAVGRPAEVLTIDD